MVLDFRPSPRGVATAAGLFAARRPDLVYSLAAPAADRGDLFVRHIAVRRSFAGCAGALSVALWISLLAPPAHAAPPAQAIALDVVVPADHLAPLAARVMRSEAARIWAREGVRLVWRASASEVPAGEPFVRVTLIGDDAGTQRTPETYVLGDFLPDEGRIRLSIFAASRAARDATAASRRPQAVYEYPLSLGYVLGRALSHEIGHALLGRGHSESGLMSASFKPLAIADSRTPDFRLNADDAARLPRSLGDARLALNRSLDDTPAGPDVVGVPPADLAR
jgi:hypothetical protein